jgi:hypothetical protein
MQFAIFFLSGQGGAGSMVFIGMDLTNEQQVVLTEWLLQWRIISKKKSQARASDLEDDTEGKEHLKQVY